MKGRAALACLLLASGFAGCFDEAPEAVLRAEQGWYHAGPNYYVLGIDGPFTIRDHDDALRPAYRITYDKPGDLDASWSGYVDANGLFVRDDGCHEFTVNTCGSSIWWDQRGLPARDGIAWPLLPRGVQLTTGEGQRYTVDATQRDGIVKIHLSGDATGVATYRVGELLPLTFGAGEEKSNRSSHQVGEPLGVAEAWPIDDPVRPVGTTGALFPGDDTDPWGLGYTHREAFEELQQDATARSQLEEGCLAAYSVARRHDGGGLFPPTTPVASHIFTIVANGSARDWHVESKKDAIGVLSFDIEEEYPSSAYGHCPPGSRAGLVVPVQTFLDRAAKYRLHGEYDTLTVEYAMRMECQGCAASRPALYHIWSDYPAPTTAKVLEATMGGDGRWIGMVLADSAEGFIDRDPPMP